MNSLFKIFILSVAVSCAACDSKLNVLPSTTSVDGTVIKDTKSAQTALNGVYYQFANTVQQSNYSATPTIGWYTVNEIFPSELSDLFGNPYGGSVLAQHIYKPSSAEAAALWGYYYNIVEAANGFIKNVSPVNSIPSDTKSQMIAESEFMRAFANAGLLFYFGQSNDTTSKYGIIIRTDASNSGNVVKARSTVAQSYDTIISDLNAAVNFLPDRNTANYYTNVWAAKLLKARVLMQRGGPSDYTQVISLCNDIITHSNFVLEDSTKDIFLTKGLASNEVMLGLQPYPNEIDKSEAYFLGFPYSLQVMASDNLVGYLTDDARRNWMIQPDSLFGAQIYLFTKYYSGSVSNLMQTSASELSFAFRLSEAYLLEAEAIASSGGNLNDAKSLLLTVQSHAGAADSSAVEAQTSAEGLKEMIIKEDMINFAAEAGQDWLAVLRLPFATIQRWVPSIVAQAQLVLPVPQNEMLNNSALQGMQNPGYGSN